MPCSYPDALTPSLLFELARLGLSPPAEWDPLEECAIYLMVNVTRWQADLDPWLYIGAHRLSPRETWDKLRYKGSGKELKNWTEDEVVCIPLEAVTERNRVAVETEWLEGYDAAGDRRFANRINEGGGFTSETSVEMLRLVHAEKDEQGRSIHSLKLHAEKDEQGRSIHTLKLHAEKDEQGRSLVAMKCHAEKDEQGRSIHSLKLHAEKDEQGRSKHAVKNGLASTAKKFLPPELFEQRGRLYGQVELIRGDLQSKNNRRERIALARGADVCCLSGLPLMRPMTPYAIKKGWKTRHKAYEIALTDRGVMLTLIYNWICATPPEGEPDGSVPMAESSYATRTPEEQERQRAAERAAQRAQRARTRQSPPGPPA